MRKEIPAETGTYVLLFQAMVPAGVKVGKLGTVKLEPGFYVYVGSAFGPGGLKARVGRHLKKRKKLKWHIDYLRKHLEVIDICFSVKKQKLECRWAAKFAAMGGESLLKGLGASDCQCPTHFWFFRELPDLEWIK